MKNSINYNLKLPEIPDIVKVSDLSENFIEIDKQMKINQTNISNIKPTKIVDNLNSNATDEALSANQGNELRGKIELLDNDINLKVDNHINDSVNTTEGVHRIRIQQNKIEWQDDEGNWNRVSGGETPPFSDLTGLKLKATDKEIKINWTDPSDVIVSGNVVTKWAGTRLIRKIGSYPKNESDGTVVVNSSIRNQYKTNPYIDTGLINGTTYYYLLVPYSDDGQYTISNGNRLSGTPSAQRIYGIVIDENNSNPETAVKYTDDAIGFTPMRGNNGAFQWGSWQAIFNDIGIKPCLLKNGVVQYYLNPNDYTKKADGSNADITSGNDGDVMIEFPKIYWKINRVGTKLYVKYSTKQFDGSINAAHKISSVEKDKIYLSAYMGNEISGKLRSLSGKSPTVSKTIGAFRTSAQANGAGYQQTTYYALLMLQVLYLVWFKNLNSQTALGRGYVDGNSASINTGGANSKGMFYGETSGKQQNKFCGIEDFWGNVYYWIDGLYSDPNRNIMISKQNVFNDNGTGYSNHGIGASANISGYINKVQGGNETGFIIKEKDGSSSTYFADIGALSAGCLPLFGGSWATGDGAGAFRLHVAYSASYSYSGIGARSCFIGS